MTHQITGTKHLIFEILEEKPKTKIFSVSSAYDKTVLGKVLWWGHWRQYVFSPVVSTETIWSDDCLLELQRFLTKLKLERKLEKENPK